MCIDSGVTDEARKKNLAWMLAGQVHVEVMASILSLEWTRQFERIISCYINAPATEMLTGLKKSVLIRYHATFCGFREGVIVSDDTDVFLLLIFSKRIWHLPFSGKVEPRLGCMKYLKYTQLYKKPVCTAIIWMYSFTGCDSVSTCICWTWET